MGDQKRVFSSVLLSHSITSQLPVSFVPFGSVNGTPSKFPPATEQHRSRNSEMHRTLRDKNWWLMRASLLWWRVVPRQDSPKNSINPLGGIRRICWTWTYAPQRVLQQKVQHWKSTVHSCSANVSVSEREREREKGGTTWRAHAVLWLYCSLKMKSQHVAFTSVYCLDCLIGDSSYEKNSVFCYEKYTTY